MTGIPKSCAVALPIQRNCATPVNGATSDATVAGKNSRKPASIRELRAQLRAQQYRNQADTVSATDSQQVAHDSPGSCALRPTKECNSATSLIAEFMEVDGLSLAEATKLAAHCVRPRPAHEWIAMVKELDSLIGEFCERFKLDDTTKELILQARNRQSLCSIAHSLEWFRNQLRSNPPKQERKLKNG